jgi:hyaluronoglucosaminidase
MEEASHGGFTDKLARLLPILEIAVLLSPIPRKNVPMETRKLGILEIFFGPPWTMEDRLGWADFLGEEELGFYLYGPKADPLLRKRWRDPWPDSFLDGLRLLRGAFHGRGVEFGLALSPFGLEQPVGPETKRLLDAKCAQLRGLGLDFLGLFFDDMQSTPGLAEKQLEVLALLRSRLELPILFCPSYYSPDPILDKVFGQRPSDYLETIASELPLDVEIAWTGPKVISEEISAAHLQETARLLRRKPFLCDNYFANDGPKNCKFLKLRHLEGRSPGALAEASRWSLNLMNQSALSLLLAKAAKLVFTGECAPGEAFAQAVEEGASDDCAKALLRDRELFLKSGLDGIDEPTKTRLAAEYAAFGDPAAAEVARWLQGRYAVDADCLTD